MAESIIEKVNILISANLHSIVDRALQQNSVAVMDEYIRRAEGNLKELEDSLASVGGSVRTLKRKYEERAAEAEKLDRSIDTLVVQGKTDLARAAQTQFNTAQEMAQRYNEEWQAQEKQYQLLMGTRLKLEARLTTMRQEREQLTELLKLAEAKRIATKTIRSLDDLAKVGDAEISGFADRVRERLDREDADLEIASQRLSDQIDEAIGNSEIDNQLEERRKRLLGSSGT
jgi:phage shock protein A